MKQLKKNIALLLLLALILSAMPISAQADSAAPMDAEPVSTAAVLPDTLEYYGRSVLESMNKPALLYAYDQIAAGVETALPAIDVYNDTQPITKDELQLVVELYRADYAHHFWLGNSYNMSYNSKTVLLIYPAYLLTGDALTAAKARFEEEASAVLSGITPDMTEYEKELYIHDTLAQRVTYNESTYAHSAYGALVDGVAVCEGYAEAFQYLLHRVGIWSFLVTGDAGGPHEWNMVRIDGNYYHVDLTWNDQGEELYHEYFNVTDAQIGKDHTADATYTLPACTASDAFYFTGKDTYLSTYTPEQVALLLQDNDLSVHIYLPGGASAFWSWFSANINQILSLAGVRSGCSYGYSRLNDEMVLKITRLGVKVTNGNDVAFYNTVANGLNNAEDNSRIKLLSDVTGDISTNQRIFMDLNGCDINGSLTGNSVTVFDSQTDDYTVENGNGYGIITGTVTGATAANGYIPVTETTGVSYHKVDVALDKLVLKADSAGLYYTGSFLYDEVVVERVAAYGVTMSTTNATPVADDTDPGCLYTTSGNSVLLKNILTEGNTVAQNKKNAKNPIYARAYLKLEDGTILYGDANTTNLQTMVETVDAKAWDRLSNTQQNALTAMYRMFEEEMSAWNIPNLKNA